ncbi:MAG: deoxyribonuclease IV, partial [Planctomycetota bacterium]
LSRLRVWHLNDSKGALGSHVDRHTHIGDGQVGKEAFAVIVQDDRFERVPKILETPKGQTPKGTPWDRVNLRRLRRLQQARSASGKRRLAPSPREPLRAVSR